MSLHCMPLIKIRRNLFQYKGHQKQRLQSVEQMDGSNSMKENYNKEETLWKGMPRGI